MAIFTNKIVSTQFIDPPANILIEVLYAEGDKIVPYTLDVDFTSSDFNDLLEEVSLEDIEKNSEKNRAAVMQPIADSINAEIDRRWAIESEKIKKAYDDCDEKIKKAYDDCDEYIKNQYKNVDEYSEEKQEDARASLKALQEGFTRGESKGSKITGKKIVDLIQTVDDKDFIFDMKVAILEDTDIAKSKDKAMKMSIRKAKTTMELLKIYTSQKV